MFYSAREITNKYIGSSTETKPTNESGGVRFYEYDTGQTYVWNGTAWVMMPAIIDSNVIFTSTGLAAAGTSTDSNVLDYHNKYPKQLAVTIAGTYAASAATTGLRLQVFYSPDGTKYDTDAYAIIEPTFAASSTSAQTKQKSRPVTAIPGYYKCNVVNLDGTNAATGITVTATEVV